MSNSSLVNVKVMTKHYGYPDGKAGRGGAKIDKIFVHHMAGILTAEQCGNVFKTREASAHYGIDTKGRVGLYVDEANAAWHCGSKAYNQRSIGIELSNDGGAKTGWHVADKTIAKCIDLIVDICKRNGIKKINYTGDLKGNLCMHRWVASTACPASYLGSKFKYIAEQVNKKLGAAPAKEVLYRVRKTWADAKSQVGAYKNLANAKKVADEKHLNVYDNNGKLVYEGAKKAEPKGYTGSFPTAVEIKTASNNGRRAYMLKWAKDIVATGKYIYKRFTDDPNTHKCPICYPKSGNGWNCMGWGIAPWKHGAGLPCNCSCGWMGDGEWDKILKMSDADALAYAQKKTGLKDVKVVRNGGKAIPTKNLQAGDILGLYYGNDIQHIVLYVGNGKITDSTTGRKPNIAYGVPMYTGKQYEAKVAIRYTGGSNYMQFYDRGVGVKKIKDFLRWYNPKNKFADDDVFGTGTETAVKEFQTNVMGKAQADGLVGPKTIDAMKKVKK